jgi:RNA polymerase sigma-70 factor, ECF subfamily
LVQTLLLGRVQPAGRMEVARDSPAALVERIRAGERLAEDELVERFSRGVTFVIRQSVKNSATAQDLYQESFRIVLEKIRAGEVREPDRLAGFICAVVRNLVIAHYRKSLKQPVSDQPEFELPSPALSPLDQLLKDEAATLARRVLAELPSGRDRKVLYRLYIAEDDKEQICKDLGLTSLLFNQVVFRARERFRKLFEERAKKKGLQVR